MAIEMVTMMQYRESMMRLYLSRCPNQIGLRDTPGLTGRQLLRPSRSEDGKPPTEPPGGLGGEYREGTGPRGLRFGCHRHIHRRRGDRSA